jgi:hypothetical protein
MLVKYEIYKQIGKFMLVFLIYVDFSTIGDQFMHLLFPKDFHLNSEVLVKILFKIRVVTF